MENNEKTNKKKPQTLITVSVYESPSGQHQLGAQVSFLALLLVHTGYILHPLVLYMLLAF